MATIIAQGWEVGRAEKYFRGILSKQNLDVLAQCTMGRNPPEQQGWELRELSELGGSEAENEWIGTQPPRARREGLLGHYEKKGKLVPCQRGR